jgi:hypothetical protein
MAQMICAISLCADIALLQAERQKEGQEPE